MCGAAGELGTRCECLLCKDSLFGMCLPGDAQLPFVGPELGTHVVDSLFIIGLTCLVKLDNLRQRNVAAKEGKEA